MINTITANQNQNSSIKQQNRFEQVNSRRSVSMDSGFSGQKNTPFNNSSSLSLILQLILRLLSQLQENQYKPDSKPTKPLMPLMPTKPSEEPKPATKPVQDLADPQPPAEAPLQDLSDPQSPPEEPIQVLPNPTPEEPISNQENLITGTVGRDKLIGTSGNDRISGLAGNDKIRGRAGDDVLLGGEGNDRLHGANGNDTLLGGAGNDSLFGGRGTNKLSGGEGNDYLQSNLGSDILDGGNGNDTARIRGRFEDYSITTHISSSNSVDGDMGSADGAVFFLTNEKTGQTVEAKNIESFRFNDRRLSSLELLRHASANQPPVQNDLLVKLSASQLENLLNLFGVDQSGSVDVGVRVIDKDGSGTVSVGDTAVLSMGDAASVSQTFRDLSAEDVAVINTEIQPPQTLTLSKAEQAEALSLFDFIANGNEKVSIQDQDGDGNISVGDIATLNASSSNSPLALTEANVRQITDRPTGELLKLDDKQKQQALDLFNAPQERARNHFINIYDSNGDGKVSQGDVAIHKVTPSIVPTVVGYHSPVTEVARKTLTEAEANQINGAAQDSQLDLSQRQHDAISYQFDDTTPLAFDGQATQYTGVAIDKDGDNTLSVGDVVKLRMYGGLRTSNAPDTIRDHVLTASEVKAIYDFSIRSIVSLSNADKSQLQSAVIRQDVGYIPGDEPRLDSVIDSDSNGHLSVGDTIKIIDTRGAETGNPTFTTRFEVLTQAQLDRYEKGIIYNPSNTVELDADQIKALQERFNLTAGLSSFTLLDSNNDQKLSAGDQLEYHQGDDPFPGTPPTSHRLTAEDVVIINGNQTQNELILTKEQHATIANRFDRTPPPNSADFITTRFTGTAIDNNNDSKLSVGDVVKLRDTGGIAGIDRIRNHVLTAEDIDAINTDPGMNTGIVKGGGVSVGGTLAEGEAIPNGRIVDINGESYTVGFLKQQVDNYVNSSFVPRGLVDAAFGIHKWGTSNSLAAGRAFEKFIAVTFPQGEPGSEIRQATLDFESNKKKWQSSQPEQYTFTLARSGFIRGDARKPIDITVKGNTVTDARFSDGSKALVPDFNRLSIDDLFKTIGTAIEKNAAEVRVKYNAGTGIPESIFIDRDRGIADEEVGFLVSNFNVIGLEE